MKNYHEMAESVFRRSKEILAQKAKKRKLVRNTIAGTSCCCLAVLLGVGIWKSGIWEQQSLTPSPDSFGSVESSNSVSSPGTTDSSLPSYAESSQITTSQESSPSVSSTGGDESHGNASSEAATQGSSQPTPPSPGTVYRTISSTYEEAKRLFGHPIIPYTGDGFNGYELAFLSANGDSNHSSARYLSVIYLFDAGRVELMDQNRLGAGATLAYDHCTSEEYKGCTFWTDSANNIVYYPLQNKLILTARLTDKERTEIYDLLLALAI